MCLASPTTLKSTSGIEVNRVAVGYGICPKLSYHNDPGKGCKFPNEQETEPGESTHDLIKRLARKMIETENVDQTAAIAIVMRAIRFRGLNDSLVKSRP